MTIRPLEATREPYETAAGAFVSRRFEDRNQVSIPSAVVKSRAGVPERLAGACLANDVASFYGEQTFTAIEEYVLKWPEMRSKGRGVLLAGASGTGKSWAAAALVNELLMSWMHEVAVNVHWFSVPMGMRRLLDYRALGRSEEYLDEWRRLTSCDLLVIDDLLHVADFPQAKEYLFALYSERDEAMLPIVTTCNAQITKGDWRAIEEVFNKPFVRRLKGNAEGYTIIFSESTTHSIQQ